MINDPEQAVTPEASAPSTDQAVTEQVDDTTVEQSAAQETTESSIPESQGDDLTKADRPAINHEMEWKRKYSELVDNLPKLIEENLQKVAQKSQPQKQEYTIEELEQIAIQNPNLRPQVEAEKEKIRERRILEQLSERDRKIEEQRRAEMVRIQVEQEVANDPSLKDCFTTDALGKKQWNMAHPLTMQIAEIMKDPRLQSSPDGLRIAADLAYGRYMKDIAAKSQTKIRAAQAAVKKEQRKTMVEGGTPTGSSAGGDAFNKLKSELAKTGSKQVAQLAVAEYMKKAGFRRE